MRILSHEIPSAVGQTVTVAGWVHRRRRLAAVSFLILRDRSGLSQIVVKAPETQAQLDELGEETVVQVTGTVAANPQAPGGVEIVDPVIEPLTEPAATPPIELWRPTVGAGLPVVLDNAPVALRHPVVRAGWEIAAAALHGFRSTLDGQGFTEIQTPKIVGAATESGANVFALDYFGRPGVPRAVAAVLQADDGRRVRAGLRGRTGVPGRAARHRRGTSPSTSRSTPRSGFIQDHRDVIAVLRSTRRRHAGRGRRAGRRRRSSCSGSGCPRSRSTIPIVHFSEALRDRRRGPGRAGPRAGRTSGGWASGRSGARLRLPRSSRATRW